MESDNIFYIYVKLFNTTTLNINRIIIILLAFIIYYLLILLIFNDIAC